MKSFKSQKGITLVALVVTIIVLLILAGITLSLVAGSNGIMARATNAANRNEAATAAEQAELKLAELQMDYYNDYYVDASTSSTMTDYIESKIGSGVACSNSRYFMTVTGGVVNVYVGSDATGTLVTSRTYQEDADLFTWVASKWNYDV